MATQLIRSTLDSRMIVTGPLESAGITTEVLGTNRSLWRVIWTVQIDLALVCNWIVAGPAMTGAELARRLWLSLGVEEDGIPAIM